MNAHHNELGQPIGEPLPNWSARPRPPRTPLSGTYCRVEPLDVAAHAGDLFHACAQDKENRIWTYLGYGPFDSEAAYREWMNNDCVGDDPLFHAIVDLHTTQAAGVASLMRIEPEVGVIEVGHINLSPMLQRTPAATEAMYLLMRRVFDELGYRRYEWKCDALNAPSRRAAERLGFKFEGIFRQATIYKERNRDTAWFSILDSEWPALEAGFERWLDPGNFDERGVQVRSLVALTEGARNG
ncbi:MAG: GNAT family N-acetyltransferase [Gammaproteobacteria bacterium]